MIHRVTPDSDRLDPNAAEKAIQGIRHVVEVVLIGHPAIPPLAEHARMPAQVTGNHDYDMPALFKMGCAVLEERSGLLDMLQRMLEADHVVVVRLPLLKQRLMDRAAL